MKAGSRDGGGMRLDELLAGLSSIPAPPVAVTDISMSSREVAPGGLFIAVPGLRSHGLAYADEAIRRGASVILWQPVPGLARPVVPRGVVAFELPGLKALAGRIADRFFGRPSAELLIAGVTGTNGKTTCAYLIAQSLSAAGQQAAYAGTLGYGRLGELRQASHTTPDSVSVHRQLAELRDSGARHIGMEVSSHALDQQRVAGVRFHTAVFTNLTRDHLDYHGTLEAYGAAKARLFELPGLRHRVVNVADPFGRELTERTADPQSVTACWTGTRKDASPGTRFIRGHSIVPARSGLVLRFDGTWGAGTIRSRLVGDFNADNLLAALAVLLGWDVPLARAVPALESCSAPPGRMETFGGEQDPLVVVDYAHTPDALAKALKALRRHCRGRLFCVFGCGGERDPGKRPMMGAIAEELADIVVVTDDNPRGENPDRIVTQILEGMQDRRRARIERDRGRAITATLAQARVDDAVLIAGKGHETSQIIGAEIRPFSDRVVVSDSLRGER